MADIKSISRLLDEGSSEEKIKVLERLQNIPDKEIVEKIILRLDDPDIRVRGEAFCSLILNKNKISDLLKKSLDSSSKNIRGFSALVLANRNDAESIDSILKLTKDESSLVRACALGALGHLKAHQAKNVFNERLFDKSMEVRKSALKGIIDIDESISEEKIREISKNKDDVLEKLLIKVKKHQSGPGGI